MRSPYRLNGLRDIPAAERQLSGRQDSANSEEKRAKRDAQRSRPRIVAEGAIQGSEWTNFPGHSHQISPGVLGAGGRIPQTPQSVKRMVFLEQPPHFRALAPFALSPLSVVSL